MKNLFKKALKTTIICSLLVFSSCEKDLYEDGIKNSSKDISVTHISLSSIDKSISSKIKEKISLIKNLKNKSNSQEKFQYNNNLGMYIDTENGKLVNNKGKLYYTFPMFRESEKKLENILFSPLNTQEIETYIAKYNITPKEFKDITYTQIQILNPELQKLTVNGWYIMCVDTQVSSQVPPTDQGELTGNFGTVVVWETTGSVCTFFDNDEGSSGNGSGDPAGYENSNNGTSGSNGGTGNQTGGVISTTPTLSPGQDTIDEFLEQLSTEQHGQRDCFEGLTQDKKDKILNFVVAATELEDSNCPNNPTNNDDVFNFAEDIISSQCGANAEEKWEKFENWFLAPLEGQEDTSAANLEDLNLSFLQQSLPTFDDFLIAYPSHLDDNYKEPEQVYTAIGGAVLTKYNGGARNTCALRVSRGLNYSGAPIPNIPNVTVKGADNKNYFLVAKNLLSWMKSTFGTPTGGNHLTECQGGAEGINFPSLLQGKKGIYIMIAKNPALFHASGHADMFFADDCDGSCYFGADGGVKDIFFWELP